MNNGKKGGPPPKELKLKSCGAYEDEEDCPTQDKQLPWSTAKENFNMSNNLVENYLQYLYTDYRSKAKEWRGPNLPVDGKDYRINWIGRCMSLESNRMKINCLRKLRDQAAMNPFYQARLDRFVDAITGIYEPTDQQGTIPGNEFKSPVQESKRLLKKVINSAGLSEKAWDYDDSWEDKIKLGDIQNLLGLQNADQKTLDMLRHTIQPALIQLFKNAGGDYRGREKMRNSDHGDFSGMDWIDKHLPKGWQEKLRKYMEKVAKEHD